MEEVSQLASLRVGCFCNLRGPQSTRGATGAGDHRGDGSGDGPVISGDTSGSVVEDGNLTMSGTLSVTDTDTSTVVLTGSEGADDITVIGNVPLQPFIQRK